MNIPIKAGLRQNHNQVFRLVAKAKALFTSKEPSDFRNIPVIINNYNRLEYLKKLVNWLESSGMKKIYIIDNASTYPPLLEYYKKSPHWIFRLNENVGYMSLWRTHIFMFFRHTPYVYTDPDILPIESCPRDAIRYFQEILERYPDAGKVGFGLKIDDLPDYFPLKEEVIKWESRFWEDTCKIEENLYEAMIDTTFALYRANHWGDAGMLKGIRTAGSYMARHLPWYINPDNLSEEEHFYQRHASHESTWYQRLTGKTTSYNG